MELKKKWPTVPSSCSMDGEEELLSGHSQKEKKTSYKCFLNDVEKLEEPEEHSTNMPYKVKSPCTMSLLSYHL